MLGCSPLENALLRGWWPPPCSPSLADRLKMFLPLPFAFPTGLPPSLPSIFPHSLLQAHVGHDAAFWSPQRCFCAPPLAPPASLKGLKCSSPSPLPSPLVSPPLSLVFSLTASSRRLCGPKQAFAAPEDAFVPPPLLPLPPPLFQVVSSCFPPLFQVEFRQKTAFPPLPPPYMCFAPPFPHHLLNEKLFFELIKSKKSS